MIIKMSDSISDNFNDIMQNDDKQISEMEINVTHIINDPIRIILCMNHWFDTPHFRVIYNIPGAYIRVIDLENDFLKINSRKILFPELFDSIIYSSIISINN